MAQDLIKSKRWLWLLLCILPFLPLLVLGLVKDWKWVSDNWDKVLSVSFGVEGIVTFILADKASLEISQHLQKIRESEENASQTLEDIKRTEALLQQDVINLEDATRRNLSGFAEIFDRSLWLLERADREIIYANFALGFGNPHRKNEHITHTFKELEHRKSDSISFGHAVDKFWTTLQERAATIRKLKVVTLDDETYEKAFIAQLAKREGYNHLNDPKVVHDILCKEKTFRSAFLKTLQAREGQREGAEANKGMTEEWLFGSSLPVQVLIAGLEAKKESSDETRFGCVVFLLGTESVSGVKKPGLESGFYTELPHIIHMYRDLVDNVGAGSGFRTRFPEASK